jgi:hypothetical protein
MQNIQKYKVCSQNVLSLWNNKSPSSLRRSTSPLWSRRNRSSVMRQSIALDASLSSSQGHCNSCSPILLWHRCDRGVGVGVAAECACLRGRSFRVVVLGLWGSLVLWLHHYPPRKNTIIPVLFSDLASLWYGWGWMDAAECACEGGWCSQVRWERHRMLPVRSSNQGKEARNTTEGEIIAPSNKANEERDRQVWRKSWTDLATLQWLVFSDWVEIIITIQNSIEKSSTVE